MHVSFFQLLPTRDTRNAAVITAPTMSCQRARLSGPHVVLCAFLLLLPVQYI